MRTVQSPTSIYPIEAPTGQRLASPVRLIGFAPIGNMKAATGWLRRMSITLSAPPAGTTARSPIFPIRCIVHAGKKSNLRNGGLFTHWSISAFLSPQRPVGDEQPLVFDFLANPPDAPGAPKVMTGHDNGIITLSLVEANDAIREQLRVSMGEPYRTLLGHFRHECGHFYWDKLVRDGGKIDRSRAIFGGESDDYEDTLKRHYASGAPPTWQQEFVSAYATSHPWEDFAETFAHYLHIIDTLETARTFGLRTRPAVPDGDILRAKVDFDPHRCRDINQIIDAWLPLTLAMNCINRSMGQSDLYPFVLSPSVIGKLGYIGKLIHACSAHGVNRIASSYIFGGTFFVGFRLRVVNRDRHKREGDG